jgi:DnaK suppressor protein
MVRSPAAPALDFSQGAAISRVEQFAHHEGVFMKTYHSGLAAEYDQLLAHRELELCAVLRARDERAMSAGHDGVSDFKDLANRESQETVDEVQAEHSALELEQVIAARRRIQELSYGLCQDCGEPIDLRRLSAMPATPYCTSCQSQHENQSEPVRH